MSSLETKTQPTWGVVPDEPEDVDLVEDARAWSRIYGELVHSMSVVAAERGAVELLDRLAEAEQRWAWWRHRVAELSGRAEEPALRRTRP